MLEFRTSYDRFGVMLKIFANKIRISQVPLSKRGRRGSCSIHDYDDKEIHHALFTYDENAEIPIPALPDGEYYINLFIAPNEHASMFWTFIQAKSVRITSRGGRIHFVVSDVSRQNYRIMSRLPMDESKMREFTRPSYRIPSDHPDIVRQAKEITKFSVTPYQKIKKIHDWVAHNIYYDRDSLTGPRKSQDALAVLKSKMGVCEGYTNLSVALIRACGVPAFGQMCYSLDISDLTLNQIKVSELVPNHILCLAFADGRWTINDVTWDSDNVYEGGKFGKRTDSGISYNYFNSTIEFISNTHIFY